MTYKDDIRRTVMGGITHLGLLERHEAQNIVLGDSPIIVGEIVKYREVIDDTVYMYREPLKPDWPNYSRQPLDQDVDTRWSEFDGPKGIYIWGITLLSGDKHMYKSGFEDGTIVINLETRQITVNGIEIHINEG